MRRAIVPRGRRNRDDFAFMAEQQSPPQVCYSTVSRPVGTLDREQCLQRHPGCQAWLRRYSSPTRSPTGGSIAGPDIFPTVDGLRDSVSSTDASKPYERGKPKMVPFPVQQPRGAAAVRSPGDGGPKKPARNSKSRKAVGERGSRCGRFRRFLPVAAFRRRAKASRAVAEHGRMSWRTGPDHSMGQHSRFWSGCNTLHRSSASGQKKGWVSVASRQLA
jgi:hypothetical protein